VVGVVIVLGAVGGLTGEIVADGSVLDDGGRSEATFESCSVVDGFDGRAGLAGTKGDIDLAIIGGIKVVFGADHG